MEFLNEFAAFVGDLVTAHDKILLLGDFNIHICCASKTLSMEVLNLIESFDFVQWVSGPHSQGHSLDLILTHGLSVLDITISNATFSDHMPVFFSVPYLGTPRNQPMERICLVFSLHAPVKSSLQHIMRYGIPQKWNLYCTTRMLMNISVTSILLVPSF